MHFFKDCLLEAQNRCATSGARNMDRERSPLRKDRERSNDRSYRWRESESERDREGGRRGVMEKYNRRGGGDDRRRQLNRRGKEDMDRERGRIKRENERRENIPSAYMKGGEDAWPLCRMKMTSRMKVEECRTLVTRGLSRARMVLAGIHQV